MDEFIDLFKLSMNKIIKSGLDRIVISLDSAKKETYEKIRVGAIFEKTYESVIEFIEIKEIPFQKG